MSNTLKRMKKKIGKSKEMEIQEDVKPEIFVHGAMKYKCESCGREWWMFLEKGLEEFGENHKPVPFVIRCKCGGMARDISGICKLPEFETYSTLPEGESYFANKKDSDCGVPILR